MLAKILVFTLGLSLVVADQADFAKCLSGESFKTKVNAYMTKLCDNLHNITVPENETALIQELFNKCQTTWESYKTKVESATDSLSQTGTFEALMDLKDSISCLQKNMDKNINGDGSTVQFKILVWKDTFDLYTGIMNNTVVPAVVNCALRQFPENCN